MPCPPPPSPIWPHPPPPPLAFQVVLFGWWVAAFYVVCAGLMFVTVIGQRYGWLLLYLARYVLWPFGKPLERLPIADQQQVCSSVCSALAGSRLWRSFCVTSLTSRRRLRLPWSGSPFIFARALNLLPCFLRS